MKKYLIKGALALFAGGLFFSCAEKESEYVPVAQQKLESYEQVFKEAYGDIDPYQNWGFSSKMELADESNWDVVYIDSIVKVQAGTRAGTREMDIDVNTYVGAYPDANMWTSKGFLAPDPLTHAQKLRAQYYFQMVYDPGFTVNYGTINFFMQQVYDGGTDAMPNKSPEIYSASDGTVINSGLHMDHLTAGPDHEHIYNFNNGTCSTNDNVANRDQTDVNDTGQQHPDEIMLMLNTYTSCFGYANSDASIVRDDRWRLVNASTIDDYCDNDPNFATWLASKLSSGEVDKKCDDEFHRSFIGFDFEMLTDESIYSNEYYRPDLYGETYRYLIAQQNRYCGDFESIDPEPNDADALTLLEAGYLPVSGSANKKWVRVKSCADGYYSDWIVSFLPASSAPPRTSETETRLEVTRKKVPVTSQCGRIFCEDLAVSKREDLDFNDVVFDVYVYKNFEEGTLYYTEVWSDGERVDAGSEPYSTENDATYTCEIILQAAGGTLPLTINDIEVHEAFGVGVTTMVNTYDANTTAYGSFETCDPVSLGEFTASQIIPGASDKQEIHAADIPLYVNYGTNQIGYIGSTMGGATAKIFVPNYTTKWTVERKAIDLAYPKFRDFVGNHDISWYDDSDLTTYLASKGQTQEQAAATIQQAEYCRHGNNAPAYSSSRPPIVITHITYPASSEDNLWTGSEAYPSTWALKEMNLSYNSFNAGDHILFHAENLTDNSFITVVYADDSQPYFLNIAFPNYKTDENGVQVPADKGVIEVVLDEDNAAKLTSTVTTYGKIKVQGRDFTLKKIGRVRASTN